MKLFIGRISWVLFAWNFSAFGFEEQSNAMLGSEDIYLDDVPVVISATRLAQPLNESPVATSIIDRQMIEASGAQTIADVLRLVPGFSVGYLTGNLPVATYHGHSSRLSKRIQLVIDGRSVYLPTLSGVSWSDLVITLDDIERIEVVRGPNAAAYGNNSFLAVVSITTRHAIEDQGHFVKNTVGSHDTSNVIYRFGNQFEDLDYRISIGTRTDEGTDLLDDFTETDYLSYRLDFQLDNTTHLFYQGGIQESRYGDFLESPNDSDNPVDVTTAFQHIRLESSFEDDSSLTLQYYYNFTKSFDSNLRLWVTPAANTMGTPLEPIFQDVDDFGVYDTIDLESERHDLELTYYHAPGEQLRLVSGGSIRADRVDGVDVFDPDTDNTLWLFRAFTQGEYRYSDHWVFNAGIMLENNDISETDIAPRLAVIHHLNPQHSLRLSASRATRTPTMYDEHGYIAVQVQVTQNGGEPLDNPYIESRLGGDVLIDPFFYSSGNVESEKITSLELGWFAQLLDNTLALDVKLFVDQTRDLIEEIPFDGDVPTENIDDLLGPTNRSNGANDFANTTDTKTKGLEMYLDYQIFPDLRLYSFFSYIEIAAQISNNQVTDPVATSIVNQYELSAPRRSYGFMLMKEWENNLNTSLAVYHVSHMNWIDRTQDYLDDPIITTIANPTDESYSKVDLVVRKSVISSNSQVDLSLILQNLGGSHIDYSDRTLQTSQLPPPSEQDPRGYFELAFRFN